jgi:hypothetical protein
MLPESNTVSSLQSTLKVTSDSPQSTQSTLKEATLKTSKTEKTSEPTSIRNSTDSIQKPTILPEIVEETTDFSSQPITSSTASMKDHNSSKSTVTEASTKWESSTESLQKTTISSADSEVTTVKFRSSTDGYRSTLADVPISISTATEASIIKESSTENLQKPTVFNPADLEVTTVNFVAPERSTWSSTVKPEVETTILDSTIYSQPLTTPNTPRLQETTQPPLTTMSFRTNMLRSRANQKKAKERVVYGILPNNTVVKKFIEQELTTENSRVVYGILPNKTVVRKYPNGTIVADRPKIRIELTNLDPKSLMDPNSDIYKDDEDLSDDHAYTHAKFTSNAENALKMVFNLLN